VLDWSLLLAELEQPDFELLRQYLRKLYINVLELADENGFTLLHHAVLKGQDGKVKQVINLADTLQKPSKQEVQQWCNMRTHKDQFSALHLASYRGNMDAARTLIAYGADMHAENFFGLNMVHVAAQGDQATTLYFFKTQGIDINK
jgi:palmitoyltransferase ZDHHC13/17